MPDYVTHPLIKPQSIERREYQENILVQCLTENSLVVLPTGLGKTILAALLTVAKLNDDPSARVVFLAPTKPLVAQHQRVFREVLAVDPDFLNLFTGATRPKKRAELWLDTTVAFMTPQVFQNDIIARRVDLSEVVLMIFDEAHRAVGDYAYTYIAEKYAREVPTGQVLAITASPGSKPEKIQEIMENLYLRHVEVRTEESPDVKPHVHQIDVEWKLVTLPKKFLALQQLFRDQLRVFYRYLKQLGYLKSEVPENVSRKDVLQAQRDLSAQIQQGGDGTDLSPVYEGVKMTSNAMRLSHGLELLETQGVGALGKYLKKMDAESQTAGAAKSLRALVNSTFMASARAVAAKLHKAGVRHPKMREVVKEVARELARNPDSRVMVFSQYRDSVAQITRRLEKAARGARQQTLTGETPGSIRPVRFVGQQSRKGDKGMQQRAQLEAIEAFKAGEFNVLVATSVAEEGLDVSECDLVVFYDVVPSAVRTIQRRGRTGRKKRGRVVILIAKDTRDEGYYWAAKNREKRMHATLREIQDTYGNGAKLAPAAQQGRLHVHANGKIITREKPPGEKPAEPNPAPPAGEKPPRPPAAETTDIASERARDEGVAADARETTREATREAKLDATSEQPSEQPRGTDREPPSRGPDKPPQPDEFTFTLDFDPSAPGILVDTRETASPVVKALDLLGARVHLEQLPVGDYVVAPELVIERKSGPDFVSSLIDGRLFEEVVAMKHLSRHVTAVLILEGSPFAGSGVNANALLGAIGTLIAKFRVSLLQTQDAEDTARHVYYLARAAQKESKKRVPVRLKKTGSDPDTVVERLVANIPGINEVRAKKLLTEFQTLRGLFEAEVAALKRVETIGPKLAREVKRVATHKYDPHHA